MTKTTQFAEHYIPGRYVKGDPPYVTDVPADQDPQRQFYVRQWNSHFDKGTSQGLRDDRKALMATQKLQPPTRGFCCSAPAGPPPDDATFHAIIRGRGNAPTATRLIGCAPYMTRPARRGWVDFYYRYLPVCKNVPLTLASLGELESSAPGTLLASEKAALAAMNYTTENTSMYSYVCLDNLLDGLDATQAGDLTAVDMQAALVGLLKEKKETFASDAQARLQNAMKRNHAGIPPCLALARRVCKWLQHDTPQYLIDAMQQAARI